MEYRWYKNGRMIMKSEDEDRERVYDMTQEYFDDYIGNQKHYEGNLDLSGTNITSLGKLERVEGGLGLSRSNITSLGNIKYVEGYLGLFDTHLTTLGKLESVGRVINCRAGSDTHKLLLNSKFKDQVRSY